MAWRPATRSALHDQAVRHYTKAKYEIQRLLGDAPEAVTDSSVRRLQELYLDNRDLPSIPDRKFLKLKRWHLLKVAVATRLDDNPHDPVWLIRLKLWQEARQRKQTNNER